MKEARLYLIRKHGKRCGYCFQPDNNLVLDSIHPSRKEDNLILCCQECRQLKASMDIDDWLKFIGWEL